MSLAINLTPSISYSEVNLINSPNWLSISRTLTTFRKSTAFKVIAEITTLLTIFTAATIWMFAI
ncbi:MAG: hypothetical protein U9Q63_04210 [Patescibacteria group bacterium]|nr:hypothetical protein [Patescibacteria group bacterium]